MMPCCGGLALLAAAAVRDERHRLGSRVGVALVVSVILVALAALRPANAQSPTPSRELQGLIEITSNFYKAGSYPEALETAEKGLALTIREFGPDHERTAIQTYSVGLIAEAAGRLDVAERSYRESVRIRDKIYGPDSAGTAQGLEKLGGVMLRAGRLDEAEALFQRVLKIRGDLVGPQHSFNASALADLGAVSLARGRFAKAHEYYREAVRLLSSQQTTQTVARAIIDDEIRRNHGAFAGLADAAWEMASSGDRSQLQEETFAASQQAWTTSAASALARMSARIGAADTELGRRIRRLQDMSERILALHEEDMKALAAWSEVQRASPGYSAALEAFRQASIAQARENAPVVSRQKALIDQLQTLLKRCPPGQKAPGCEPRDLTREAISRELGALSAEAAKGSGNLMALNQRLQAAEKTLPGADEFSRRRTARLDESQRLEQTLTEERAAVIKAFPDYAALTDPRPLAITEAQSLLQPNEALVTILVGPTRSFAWAVSRDRAEWTAINATTAELSAHVTTLRRGLDPAAAEQPDSAVVSGGYDLARAHTLYRLLLGPLTTVIEGKQHLIVVPTGPLSSLPFQVLLTEPPDGDTTFKTAPWLIRRHALSVLPSVQSLAALRRLAPAHAPAKPFLGIGDPMLTSPTGAEQQQRGLPVAARRPAAVYRNGQPDVRAIRELGPLPETAEELRTIAKLLGGSDSDLLLRERATKPRLTQAPLDSYRVIEFATHALVGGELSGVDEPALVLTPPATPSEVDNGLLTASDVAGLRLAADWVVLSACNTASGTEAGAEALSGLARAFLYAGARGLLVSHWAVNSEATVALTTRTFSALVENPKLGRAEALRRTMLDMIDVGLAPTYWAPFIIVGEGASIR